VSPERWTYPPELAEALSDLGLRPAAHTSPALVRGALNGLYRYELRRLRDAHRAGAVPKPEFLDRVVALRKKYWPLTLQQPAWDRICAMEDTTTGV
jgi:hypothetical protein